MVQRKGRELVPGWRGDWLEGGLRVSGTEEGKGTGSGEGRGLVRGRVKGEWHRGREGNLFRGGKGIG